MTMGGFEPQVVDLFGIEHHVNGAKRGSHPPRLRMAAKWPITDHCECKYTALDLGPFCRVRRRSSVPRG